MMVLWNLSPIDGFGVDINAISVVNMIMAMGLSVEFVVHVTTAFSNASGTREDRAKKALSLMGSSVFTGITITKLCGVYVLGFAPSSLFRLYYFRMYICIIVLGAFHGLAFMPVLLSLIGPKLSKEAVRRASVFVSYDDMDEKLEPLLGDLPPESEVNDDDMDGMTDLKEPSYFSQ